MTTENNTNVKIKNSSITGEHGDVSSEVGDNQVGNELNLEGINPSATDKEALNDVIKNVAGLAANPSPNPFGANNPQFAEGGNGAASLFRNRPNKSVGEVDISSYLADSPERLAETSRIAQAFMDQAERDGKFDSKKDVKSILNGVKHAPDALEKLQREKRQFDALPPELKEKFSTVFPSGVPENATLNDCLSSIFMAEHYQQKPADTNQFSQAKYPHDSTNRANFGHLFNRFGNNLGTFADQTNVFGGQANGWGFNGGNQFQGGMPLFNPHNQFNSVTPFYPNAFPTSGIGGFGQGQGYPNWVEKRKTLEEAAQGYVAPASKPQIERVAVVYETDTPDVEGVEVCATPGRIGSVMTLRLLTPFSLANYNRSIVIMMTFVPDLIKHEIAGLFAKRLFPVVVNGRIAMASVQQAGDAGVSAFGFCVMLSPVHTAVTQTEELVGVTPVKIHLQTNASSMVVTEAALDWLAERVKII